ncbi:hypothetical protein SmJEL517_g03646 [Synchytrium microbalum]|uniref:HAUS augmin-like complex subunit 3 N-terminal domain-containing protein n=1 Tax=Synchytrium microbalum TaxID=1806994 RepID=A0A507C240_9FUNG|nr:uncharacterized protein SmJEL517_g03646 [Synchytrium microbalum]TPX33491.1 hypothetical protein SmJEL517_g03646 [Synchytrium microbalum]
MASNLANTLTALGYSIFETSDILESDLQWALSQSNSHFLIDFLTQALVVKKNKSALDKDRANSLYGIRVLSDTESNGYAALRKLGLDESDMADDGFAQDDDCDDDELIAESDQLADELSRLKQLQLKLEAQLPTLIKARSETKADIKHWERQNDLADSMLEQQMQTTCISATQTISAISNSVQSGAELMSAGSATSTPDVYLHQCHEEVAKFESADDAMRNAAMSWISNDWLEMPQTEAEEYGGMAGGWGPNEVNYEINRLRSLFTLTELQFVQASLALESSKKKLSALELERRILQDGGANDQTNALQYETIDLDDQISTICNQDLALILNYIADLQIVHPVKSLRLSQNIAKQAETIKSAEQAEDLLKRQHVFHSLLLSILSSDKETMQSHKAMVMSLLQDIKERHNQSVKRQNFLSSGSPDAMNDSLLTSIQTSLGCESGASIENVNHVGKELSHRVGSSQETLNGLFMETIPNGVKESMQAETKLLSLVSSFSVSSIPLSSPKEIYELQARVKEATAQLQSRFKEINREASAALA